MANRYFNQFVMSFDSKRVVIDGSFPVTDASGTVGTLSAAGVSSVVRNSTGKYTVTLQDNYNQFLGGSVTLNMAGSLASVDVILTTPAFSANINQLVFTCVNTSGTAVDVPASTTFYFNFVMKNSNLRRGE